MSKEIDKDKIILELNEKILKLENENKQLKNKLSTQKRLNTEKENRKLNKKSKKTNNNNNSNNNNNNKDYDNFDSSTDEDNYTDTENEGDNKEDQLMKDIDLEELKQKKKNELTLVAKSINIETKRLKKSQILNKIQDKIKFRTIKKQKRNGSLIKRKSLLVVPIENQTEKLWWKVIRNIYLFRKILGYLSTGPHGLKYDQLFNLQLLINTNQIGLIKYKVERNDYITNFQSMHKLFNLIKNDKSFYFNLFRNYPKITLFSVQSTGQIAANVCCSAALEILIKSYNFKPTLELFKNITHVINLKTFKVLINYFKESNNGINVSDADIWKTLIQNYQTVPKGSKLINWLIEEKQFELPNITETRFSKIYKQLINDPLNSEFSIKDLINIAKSIFNLNLQNKTKLIPKLDNQFKSTNELNQLLLKYSKQELKETVFDYFKNNYFKFKNQQQQQQQQQQFNEKYQTILKLLSLYYSIIGYTNPFFLLILNNNGQNDDEAEIEKNKQLLKSNIKQTISLSKYDEYHYNIVHTSLRFGNLDLLLDDELLPKLTYSITSIPLDHISYGLKFKNLLFQFQDDREKQLDFIKTVSNLIKTKKTSLDSNIWFFLVIEYDDLEFINLAYNELGDSLNLQIEKLSHDPLLRHLNEFYFIKSVETLEFLFNNCFKDKIQSKNITNFIINSRIDLIEKYASLLPKTIGKLRFDSSNLIYPNNILSTFKKIKENTILSNMIDIEREQFKKINSQTIQTISDITWLIENCQYQSFSFTFIPDDGNNDYYLPVALSRWSFYYELNNNLSLGNRILWGYGHSQIPSLFEFKPDIQLYNPDIGYLQFIKTFMKKHFSDYIVKDSNNNTDAKELDDEAKEIDQVDDNDQDKMDDGKDEETVKKTFGRAVYIEDHGLLNILNTQATAGNLLFFKTLVNCGFQSLFHRKKDNDKSKVFFNQFNIRDILLNSLKNDHLELSIFLIEQCKIKITKNIFNSVFPKHKTQCCVYFHLFNRFD